MILTGALLLLLTTNSISESHQEYQRLSKQLANQIEWIDDTGSHRISKTIATQKLMQLSDKSVKEISTKHYSSWKNGKCYWVFNLITPSDEHRVFFFCRKNKSGQTKVTKIKVS